MHSYTADLPVRELAVVIPIYNDSAILEPALNTIMNHLDTSDLDWEIVLIDDHSTDESTNILNLMGIKKHPRVQMIRLAQNYGQHVAFYAGIQRSTKKWCLTFDLDSAPALVNLNELLQACDNQKSDLVSISRKGQRSVPLHRRIGSFLLSHLANMATGKHLSDPLSPLKLGHVSIREKLTNQGEKRRFLSACVIQSATSVSEISIDLPRRRGRTLFDFFDLLKLMFDFTLNFFPKIFIRMAVMSISSIAAALFISFVYLLLRILSVIEPSLHFQVIAGVLLMISFNVFMMAIFGEYHLRTYQLLQKKEFFKVEGENDD